MNWIAAFIAGVVGGYLFDYTPFQTTTISLLFVIAYGIGDIKNAQKDS